MMSDQFLMTPFMTSVFFAVMTTLEGHPDRCVVARQAKERIPFLPFQFRGNGPSICVCVLFKVARLFRYRADQEHLPSTCRVLRNGHVSSHTRWTDADCCCCLLKCQGPDHCKRQDQANLEGQLPAMACCTLGQFRACSSGSEVRLVVIQVLTYADGSGIVGVPAAAARHFHHRCEVTIPQLLVRKIATVAGCFIVPWACIHGDDQCRGPSLRA
eukprot:1142852-Pelagomonas_calceolata.AAC.1